MFGIFISHVRMLSYNGGLLKVTWRLLSYLAVDYQTSLVLIIAPSLTEFPQHS